jgi:hypothetical protein
MDNVIYRRGDSLAQAKIQSGSAGPELSDDLIIQTTPSNILQHTVLSWQL